MIRKLLMLLAFFIGITTVTSQEYIEMTKMSKADSIRNNSLKESKKKQ